MFKSFVEKYLKIKNPAIAFSKHAVTYFHELIKRLSLQESRHPDEIMLPINFLDPEKTYPFFCRKDITKLVIDIIDLRTYKLRHNRDAIISPDRKFENEREKELAEENARKATQDYSKDWSAPVEQQETAYLGEIELIEENGLYNIKYTLLPKSGFKRVHYGHEAIAGIESLIKATATYQKIEASEHIEKSKNHVINLVVGKYLAQKNESLQEEFIPFCDRFLELKKINGITDIDEKIYWVIETLKEMTGQIIKEQMDYQAQENIPIMLDNDALDLLLPILSMNVIQIGMEEEPKKEELLDKGSRCLVM